MGFYLISDRAGVLKVVNVGCECQTAQDAWEVHVKSGDFVGVGKKLPQRPQP